MNNKTLQFDDAAASQQGRYQMSWINAISTPYTLWYKKTVLPYSLCQLEFSYLSIKLNWKRKMEQIRKNLYVERLHFYRGSTRKFLFILLKELDLETLSRSIYVYTYTM